MYEIYDNHADGYDALVGHEDHAGNLRVLLQSRFDWTDAVVAEAGIGTGRVTRAYIDRVRRVHGFDRSAHMLERAAENLSAWADRLRLTPADNSSLPIADASADIFIEGWAFGHAAVDRPAETAVVARELIAEADRVTRPGGAIVIIETLGTNVDKPAAPLPVLRAFYTALEQEHGFVREVVRTDYAFESPHQAEELCGFFFGEAMGAAVRARLTGTAGRSATPGVSIIPEFTGVWVRAGRESAGGRRT